MVVVLNELRIGLDATLFGVRDGALLETELLVLTFRCVIKLRLLSWLSELVDFVVPVMQSPIREPEKRSSRSRSPLRRSPRNSAVVVDKPAKMDGTYEVVTQEWTEYEDVIRPAE